MIALPLLMLSRGIDIVSLRFICASLPMVFQLTRLLFATLSDVRGRKLFFVSNGILTVLTLFAYYLAFFPLKFLFGKITEGTRNASLWAVNRPAILDRVKEKRKALSRLMSFNRVSEAVGRLASGFRARGQTNTQTPDHQSYQSRPRNVLQRFQNQRQAGDY
jgi:hypothetical protein